MRTTYVTATVIAILIVLWLASGQIGDEGPESHPTLAELNRQTRAETEDEPLTRVRAQLSRAVPQKASVVISGRTENKRSVEVRSETSGTIVERAVARGDRVDEGELLCRISVDDRAAALNQAEQVLNQAEIDYQGTLELEKRGLVSDNAVAEAKARLATAKAGVTRTRLDLERTEIRAPFDGVVEQIFVEVGDFVQPGSSCATVMDLDPMLLVGRVAERQVGRLETGLAAYGSTISGKEVEGELTFVGKQSDDATRTYAIEVEVPNPDYDLRSGITTQIRIPVNTHLAHLVSPALLALDDAGRLGMRTLTDDNEVRFHLVEIIKDGPEGVWVTGLPDVTRIITVGQELVVAGETVDVSFEPVSEMPASVRDAAAPVKANAAGPDPSPSSVTIPMAAAGGQS